MNFKLIIDKIVWIFKGLLDKLNKLTNWKFKNNFVVNYFWKKNKDISGYLKVKNPKEDFLNTIRKILKWLLILLPFLVIAALFVYIYWFLDWFTDWLLRKIPILKELVWANMSLIKTIIGIVFIMWLWYAVHIISELVIWGIIRDKTEQLIMSIPIVWSIYKMVKEFTDYFDFSWSDWTWKKKKKFWLPVLVEYPKQWAYVLGFVNSWNDVIVKDCVSVYVPTAPNPTSWYNVLYEKKDVKVLDVTIEDMMKYIIWLWAVEVETFTKDIRDFDKMKTLADLARWDSEEDQMKLEELKKMDEQKESV